MLLMIRPARPTLADGPLADLSSQTAIDVEAAATDQGDRLAKSSRDVGEKRFIIMK